MAGIRPGLEDVWVVKIDNAGNIQWQRCYGGQYNETGWGIQQATDGGYLVAGLATSSDGDVTGTHGYSDLWILKINSTGILLWQRAIGGSGGDEYPTIVATNDGGCLIAGSIDSYDGDIACSIVLEDLWLAKLDVSGNIQWQSCLGGNYGEVNFALIKTSDGGYLTGGVAYSTSLPGNYGLGGDGWVVKWSSTGGIQWQRFLGGTATDVITSVQQTTDGGYIVAGYTTSSDGELCSNRGEVRIYFIK